MVPNCNQFSVLQTLTILYPKVYFEMLTSVWKRGKYLFVTMERLQVSHCRPAVNITAAGHNGLVHKALNVQRSTTVIIRTACLHQYYLHRTHIIYFRYFELLGILTMRSDCISELDNWLD
jgi:hypothetical protein